MIRELLLVHHSHTDVGYTHPQPVVLELHRRYLDGALDLIERTEDWAQDCRFRWTCEVAGPALDWWERADDRRRERFVAAARSGRLEVAALAWNLTPLADHETLVRALEPARFFRSVGVPVRHAMQSDVNGLPWGVVDVLLDHGIEGLSMAVNEHFGHAPQPRPRGFRWESPSGRAILAHNGLIYGNTVEYHLGIPLEDEVAARMLPAALSAWEERGYPHAFMMVQPTNLTFHDNAPPNLELARFVSRWNERDHPVRLRLATLAEFFDRLRAEPTETLPALRGDWTDWWNFGSGSTALETGLALEGQRALREARQLAAWPNRPPEARRETLVAEAGRALALYAEHTWGADRSVGRPGSVETRLQDTLKSAFVAEGLSLARMLRRDGLEALARHAGGNEPHALFWNPLPHPVRRVLRVPRDGPGLEFLMRPHDQAWHRQDGELGDLEDDEAAWVGPLEVPGLGYAAWPFAELPTPAGELRADPDLIANGRLEVRFDPAGGIRSMRLDGTEYAGAARPWALGTTVLERPAGGARHEIFGPVDYRALDVHLGWHPGWAAERSGPLEPPASRSVLRPGCAAHRQVAQFANGDEVATTFRVFPGEPSLEVEVAVRKSGSADAHALYLALPLELGPGSRCHYQTAGAAVELEREQLPYASRHFVTTLDWIRLQGAERGLTVACPDAPLWQVGGFSFGRHRRGRAEAAEPLLLAWLTNNYWDTNFRADQSGLLRFRFRLIPHPAQPLDRSVPEALTFVTPPRLHLYRERGPRRHERARLLEVDAGGATLVGVEADGDSVTLRMVNPADEPAPWRASGGVLRPLAGVSVSLAGAPTGEDLGGSPGGVSGSLGPRAWAGVRLRVARDDSPRGGA